MRLDNAVMTARGSLPVQEVTAAKKWPQSLFRCALFLLVLTLLFCKPLWDLARYAWSSDLYSHVLLIPFLVGYLIALRRKELPPALPGNNFSFAGIPFMLGVATLGIYVAIASQGWHVSLNDYLSLTVFSFLCFAVAGGILFLGGRTSRAIAFPLAFLFCMVPFPEAFTDWTETFLQHASAEAANILLSISGVPFMRDGLIFHLPSIPLAVARECSGIHSSLVLFISSLLAGYLFLRNPWYRAALALSVVPLGILRNGFRIFSIGMLCVHVDPDMINSPLHRQGGPLFFLLSLVPFFLLLFYLRRLETRRRS